ncbi:MAG: hypothetical protein KF849_15135 [Rhizobiaceae bacterium]|nr:hypothetical protein [Rhizobiaceae bacterium]
MQAIPYRRAHAGAIAMVLLSSLLAGCVTASRCNTACNPEERVPAGLVRLAEKKAEPLSRAADKVHFRAGRLYGNHEAAEYLMAQMQPGDVLAVSNRGTLAAKLIPGFFTHTAAYVGNERQLRSLGLWTDPAVVPHHDAIRAGRVIIEAVNNGVVLSLPNAVFDTDRIVVARPGGADGGSPEQRRAAVAALLSRMGTPFDFHFDASTDDELFCVEFLQCSIPALRLPVETVYGRPTIKPVALAEAVFEDRSNLAFVAYLKGPGRFERRTAVRIGRGAARSPERAGCDGASTTRSSASARR